MAREVTVEFEGAVSRFALTRMTREKLYGRRRRVIVDEQGAACVAATLTLDGAALLPPGSTSDLYVDSAFDTVSRSRLRAVDSDGEPIEKVPSTLGVEQPLSGPVTPERVLDHVTNAVYLLDPTELAPGLLAQLDAGEIFETGFNYRDGYTLNPLFLLKNEAGVFALVAEPAGFEPVRKQLVPVETGEDPFADDDLDFSMF